MANRAPRSFAGLFSVIICAYSVERWDDIVEAVASVDAQTVRDLEVVLVIDHNEELLERARAAFPGVRVLRNRHSQGLSGARNTGVEVASGSIVAFLDDDATARPDWLKRLSTSYLSDLVLGVGGSAHPVWPGGVPGWLPPEFLWVVGCSYIGQPTRTEPVRNLLGCNMSFRREVFDMVGTFTVGIGRLGTRPVGCEETEFCIRVGRHKPGAVILYDPNAAVDHRVGLARTTFTYFASRCYSEGLSKALVSNSVGQESALATERRYVTHVLPKAVLRAAGAALRGDASAAARVGALLSGLGLTVVGYITGMLRAKGGGLGRRE